jgi:hypothetical protein
MCRPDLSRPGAARFVLKPAWILAVAVAAGCSSPKQEAPRSYVENRNGVLIQHVNERRDPTTGEVTTAPPASKPIETQRLNLGETKVDRSVEDSRAIPLTSSVEIRTWADAVIRGVLVDESPEAYWIQVPSKTTDGHTVRQVRRETVLSIRVVRSEGGAGD